MELWAKTKPYKSLEKHMIDAGYCTYILLTEIYQSDLEYLENAFSMTDSEIVSFLSYLTSLHDIGKAHPCFQSSTNDYAVYNRLIDQGLISASLVKGKFRHEIYSKMIMQRIFKEDSLINKRSVRRNIAGVLSLHHPGRNGDAFDIPSDYKELYELEQGRLEKEMRKVFEVSKFPESCSDWSVLEIIEPLIILSDHIASNKLFDVGEQLDNYLAYAKENAKKAVHNIGFDSADLPHIGSITDLYPFITDHTIRPIQTAAGNVPDDAFAVIIEDIPGSGKTEAANIIAFKMAEHYKKKGLYFGAPSMSTSNQLYVREAELFERLKLESTGLRLTHGTAWAQINAADDEGKLGPAWLQQSRRALLSSSAVGTVDQAMMAALTVKFNCLRMLGLSNKVLIIDEIHSYDMYMETIIVDLLSWCHTLQIPVILLSATLSSQMRKDYLTVLGVSEFEHISNEYPLLTIINREGKIIETACEAFRHTRHKISKYGSLADLKSTASYVKKAAKTKGGNICVMCNTVKDAQRLYQILQDIMPEEKSIFLFHARFTIEDRLQIEKECIGMYGKKGKRPEHSILVCTQVVEQSLDLDFDLMITQLCPIDLLIQRIGRVWRHNETLRPSSYSEPEIVVLTGDYTKNGTGFVYAHCILEKTEEYLKYHSEIRLPEDVREAIEYVYSNLDMNDTSVQEYLFGNNLEKTIAAMNTIGRPSPSGFYRLSGTDTVLADDNDTSFSSEPSTRNSSNTARVILAEGEEIEMYKRLTENHKYVPEEKKKRLQLSNKLLQKSVGIPNITEEIIDRGPLFGYIFAVKYGTDQYRIGNTNLVIRYSPQLGAIVENVNNQESDF